MIGTPESDARSAMHAVNQQQIHTDTHTAHRQRTVRIPNLTSSDTISTVLTDSCEPSALRLVAAAAN